MVICLICTDMRFRSRRSVNGVLVVFILVLVTLLVLGIVTGKIIFYILFGVLLLFAILGVVALFNFLKKTGQETSSTRRSTYDILEGKEIKGLTPRLEKDEDSASSKDAKKPGFCEHCGMKLESGMRYCSNCGKTST